MTNIQTFTVSILIIWRQRRCDRELGPAVDNWADDDDDDDNDVDLVIDSDNKVFYRLIIFVFDLQFNKKKYAI